MTGYHLAQFNIGTARAATDSPVMADFMAGIAGVNALADAAPGFVWRLQDGDGPGATALRPCGPDIMVNMSVWEDLESLREFVYRSGPHLDFMRRRRAWFHPMTVPYLVLWWVPAGHIPDPDEALARLGLLRRDGPGPEAFTFRDPYPPPSQPRAGHASGWTHYLARPKFSGFGRDPGPGPRMPQTLPAEGSP